MSALQHATKHDGKWRVAVAADGVVWLCSKCAAANHALARHCHQCSSKGSLSEATEQSWLGARSGDIRLAAEQPWSVTAPEGTAVRLPPIYDGGLIWVLSAHGDLHSIRPFVDVDWSTIPLGPDYGKTAPGVVDLPPQLYGWRSPEAPWIPSLLLCGGSQLMAVAILEPHNLRPLATGAAVLAGTTGFGYTGCAATEEAAWCFRSAAGGSAQLVGVRFQEAAKYAVDVPTPVFGPFRWGPAVAWYSKEGFSWLESGTVAIRGWPSGFTPYLSRDAGELRRRYVDGAKPWASNSEWALIPGDFHGEFRICGFSRKLPEKPALHELPAAARCSTWGHESELVVAGDDKLQRFRTIVPKTTGYRMKEDLKHGLSAFHAHGVWILHSGSRLELVREEESSDEGEFLMEMQLPRKPAMVLGASILGPVLAVCYLDEEARFHVTAWSMTA